VTDTDSAIAKQGRLSIEAASNMGCGEIRAPDGQRSVAIVALALAIGCIVDCGTELRTLA